MSCDGVMAREVRGQAAGVQEMLRKLAVIHEGFVQDKARLELDLARTSALDPKTAALIVVGVVVAIGASSACLHWSASRALAAGASADEITGVLLAIAPVAGLGRVVAAAPDLATGLGYDVEAALMEIDDP
jgi:4-carboxymuconolactone decarboxylase